MCQVANHTPASGGPQVAPPYPGPVGPVDVAVWITPVDAEPTWCTEEDRAIAFQSASALAARSTLRRILSTATGTPAAALRFATAPQGKPSLVDHPGVEFNASHADGMLAVAVSSRPVGIDIEAADRRLVGPERLARRLFSPAELAAWMGDPQPGPLLRRWTEVEAVLKGAGTGIAGGTRDAVGRLRGEGWDIRPLEHERLIGTVAVRASSWTLRRMV